VIKLIIGKPRLSENAPIQAHAQVCGGTFGRKKVMMDLLLLFIDVSTALSRGYLLFFFFLVKQPGKRVRFGLQPATEGRLQQQQPGVTSSSSSVTSRS